MLRTETVRIIKWTQFNRKRKYSWNRANFKVSKESISIATNEQIDFSEKKKTKHGINNMRIVNRENLSAK